MNRYEISPTKVEFELPNDDGSENLRVVYKREDLTINIRSENTSIVIFKSEVQWLREVLFEISELSKSEKEK